MLVNKIDLMPPGQRVVSEGGVEAVRLVSGATGKALTRLSPP
jgi:hypothetical protein